MPRLPNRPTGDLLVLAIAGTVCTIALVAAVAIVAVELFHPEYDTDPVLAQLGDVVNTLIGLLAGFLAGRAPLNVPRTGTQHTDAEKHD